MTWYRTSTPSAAKRGEPERSPLEHAQELQYLVRGCRTVQAAVDLDHRGGIERRRLRAIKAHRRRELAAERDDVAQAARVIIVEGREHASLTVDARARKTEGGWPPGGLLPPPCGPRRSIPRGACSIRHVARSARASASRSTCRLRRDRKSLPPRRRVQVVHVDGLHGRLLQRRAGGSAPAHRRAARRRLVAVAEDAGGRPDGRAGDALGRVASASDLGCGRSMSSRGERSRRGPLLMAHASRWRPNVERRAAARRPWPPGRPPCEPALRSGTGSPAGAQDVLVALLLRWARRSPSPPSTRLGVRAASAGPCSSAPRARRAELLRGRGLPRTPLLLGGGLGALRGSLGAARPGALRARVGRAAHVLRGPGHRHDRRRPCPWPRTPSAQ